MVFYHKFRLPWEKENCILSPLFPPGRVSEWSMVQPWKGCVGASLPGVRIPPLPPTRERGIPLILLENIGVFLFFGMGSPCAHPSRIGGGRNIQRHLRGGRIMRLHRSLPRRLARPRGSWNRGCLSSGVNKKVQGPFVPGGPSCLCSALAEAEPLIRGAVTP